MGGRLVFNALAGTLTGCTVDKAILNKASEGYVKAVDSFLKKVIPGGKCSPDTYAGIVYEAFAKASAAPVEVNKLEIAMMTKWCDGKAPTKQQIGDIATLKAALNLYGGDKLLNLVRCDC